MKVLPTELQITFHTSHSPTSTPLLREFAHLSIFSPHPLGVYTRVLFKCHRLQGTSPLNLCRLLSILLCRYQFIETFTQSLNKCPLSSHWYLILFQWLGFRAYLEEVYRFTLYFGYICTGIISSSSLKSRTRVYELLL